jgi:hypothetical protein
MRRTRIQRRASCCSIDARAVILQRIHSSHTGVNSWIARAKETFFPSPISEVKKVGGVCAVCQTIQVSLLKEPLMSSTLPMHMTLGNIFNFRYQHYLITGDSLTNFFEINRLPSKRMCDVIYCLKGHFSHYGLPMEVSSDNAFKNAEFSRFALDYDLKHTKSSPHYA